MRAYSLDLRERVVADYDAGLRPTEVAQKYRVSARWVYQLLARRRTCGDIAPRRGRTGPKGRLTEHRDRLEAIVRQHPDATLSELRALLGVPVGLATLWRALRKLGITLKKSPACLRAGSARRASAAHRLAVGPSISESPLLGLY